MFPVAVRKLLIFISLSAAAFSASAIDFDAACSAINGKKSGSQKNVCRYIDGDYSAAIFQEPNDYYFAHVHWFGGDVGSAQIENLKKVAKAMDVEVIEQFWESVARNGSRKIGLTYKGYVVVWAPRNSQQKKQVSMFTIIPKEGSSLERSVRCYGTSCLWSDIATWFGQTEEQANRESR